jgi:hypothetical protein
VTLTNFEKKNNDKPEVFFSGCLHGNERIGPNVLAYLSSYLLSNYGSDSWITYLLDNRKIVLMPMANAQGYFFKKRVRSIFISPSYIV